MACIPVTWLPGYLWRSRIIEDVPWHPTTPLVKSNFSVVALTFPVRSWLWVNWRAEISLPSLRPQKLYIWWEQFKRCPGVTTGSQLVSFFITVSRKCYQLSGRQPDCILVRTAIESVAKMTDLRLSLSPQRDCSALLMASSSILVLLV